MERLNERIMGSVIYQRVWPPILALTFVIAVVALVGTWMNDRANDRQDRAAIAVNKANAVTSCENANESREASRTLWNFVLDLSTAGNPDATPDEAGYIDEFRGWIDEVYKARDCSDLSRKYPIPPPPALPTPAG